MKFVIHVVYAVIGTRPKISHTQSMVAKRGLTNRENVHTPMWKEPFKTQHSRMSINPAILAAIGHRFMEKKITENSNARV